MQKKHLHGFLLILLLVGCHGHKFAANNPYLTDKRALQVGFATQSPAPALLFGPVELRTTNPDRYSEPFTFQVFPYTDGVWIGGLQVDGFERTNAHVSRTLTTLTIEDSAAGLRYAAVPLPHGAGIAFYFEGETYSPVAFNLSRLPQDTLFLHGNKAGKIEQYQLKDSSFLAIAATPAFGEELDARGVASEMHRTLTDGKHRQIIVAFDRSPDRARQLAATYRGMKREQLETAVRDSLNSVLAFSLLTEDDRTNSAFALLASALTDAQPRVSLENHFRSEDAAGLAPALFLASRARPDVAFAAGSAKENSQRVRWGLEAFRAALQYGMASDDSLNDAALRVLAEAARVHGDYNFDLFALGDELIPDTLIRLAVAHVRYAELLTLCGDISNARGDREAEENYRRDAGYAAKEARRYFTDAARLYYAIQLGHPLPVINDLDLQAPSSDSADTDELIITGLNIAHPPDTARFVEAGAHYNFAWLGEKPAALVPADLDGVTWQKWTAYRFAADYKITHTPDLDSTLKLVLNGPLPGTLSDDPGHSGEPSLAVMGAAFENLAELYLGYHPNNLQHRVTFEPRPPEAWGRTFARVPYEDGFLNLDYNFANDEATVGMSGFKQQLAIYFGYPLPTGGFSRVQFALSPEQPTMHMHIERDSDNRIKVAMKPE